MCSINSILDFDFVRVVTKFGLGSFIWFIYFPYYDNGLEVQRTSSPLQLGNTGCGRYNRTKYFVICVY